MTTKTRFFFLSLKMYFKTEEERDKEFTDKGGGIQDF